MNKKLRGFFSAVLILTIPYVVPAQNVDKSATEKNYLQTIREDFIAHRENISLIHDIGMNMVQRIDSLFAEQRADTANTELIRGDYGYARIRPHHPGLQGYPGFQRLLLNKYQLVGTVYYIRFYGKPCG